MNNLPGISPFQYIRLHLHLAQKLSESAGVKRLSSQGKTNEYVNSSVKVGTVKSPFSLLLHQCCISLRRMLRLATIQSILPHLNSESANSLSTIEEVQQ